MSWWRWIHSPLESRCFRAIQPESGIVLRHLLRFELRSGLLHERLQREQSIRRITGDDDVFEVAQTLARNGRELRQEDIADDDDNRARVIEKILVVRRLHQRVGGDWDRADLHGAEEGVDHLWRIQHQEQDAILDPDVELPQQITDSIGVLEDPGVADLEVAGVDGDFVATTFGHVSVDKVGSGVHPIWNRYFRYFLAACCCHEVLPQSFGLL